MTMPRSSAVLIALVLFVAAPAAAQQEETYDYWRPQRDMIRRGQQAIFMCNGLFTGQRSIETRLRPGTGVPAQIRSVRRAGATT